jgi:DNA-binding transcriptional MocR family regulator
MRVALGSPIEKAPNKSRQVYDGLLRLIMVGELSGGSVLAESQLAEHFGCRQATVRDALMRLQEDGLVQRAGYHGEVDAQELDCTKPRGSAVQRENAKGTVNGQLERPAPAGMAGKGAARRTASIAALSRIDDPELATTRIALTPPPAETTKLTRT